MFVEHQHSIDLLVRVRGATDTGNTDVLGTGAEIAIRFVTAEDASWCEDAHSRRIRKERSIRLLRQATYGAELHVPIDSVGEGGEGRSI